MWVRGETGVLVNLDQLMFLDYSADGTSLVAVGGMGAQVVVATGHRSRIDDVMIGITRGLENGDDFYDVETLHGPPSGLEIATNLVP